jgi:anaerobic ribonucleoside-triphosphate reductase activating protein
MQIDRILFPVRTLGPDSRMVVWTVGCPRRCMGCSNPELWAADDKKEIPLSKVFGIIDAISAAYGLDGITITGGEPFLQLLELEKLVAYCRSKTEDILVYTGYKLDELKRLDDTGTAARILGMISVLIDGEYLDDLNDGSALKGSSNQRIHILKKKFRAPYEAAMHQKRTVENFLYGSSLISVGIHEKGYHDRIQDRLKEQGITFQG